MKIYLQLFRKSAPFLVPVCFLYISLDQWITSRIETEMLSSSTSEFSIWLYAGLSMVLSLVFPLLTLMIVLATRRDLSLLEFLRKYFSLALRESMRAWGRVIGWSILLILPGMLKMLSLAFVPIIVSLDSNYQNGGTDALQRSEQLAKPVFFRLLGLFFVFSVLFPLFMTAFDDYKIFWKTPVSASLLGLAEALLMVFFYQRLEGLYQRSLSHDGAQL